jgi:hypothetical protein
MITSLASCAPDPEQVPQLAARLTSVQRSLLERLALQPSLALVLEALADAELGLIQGLDLLGLVFPAFLDHLGRVTPPSASLTFPGYLLSPQGAAVVQFLTEQEVTA